MSELVSPYINTELYSKIPLKPHQMNNDLYINLKMNLKRKVEKKCNRYGYVTKIFKILNHENGIIHTEDFTATAMYNVKYSARICIPLENTKIVCKLTKMNKVLMIANNGPIMCVMKNTDINNSVFETNNKGNISYIKKNKELKIGDYIIINVRGKKFNFGDDRIMLLGFLEDIADNKNVEKYYEEDLNTNTEEIEANNNEEIDNINESDENSEFISESEIDSDLEDSDENNLDLRNSNYIEI